VAVGHFYITVFITLLIPYYILTMTQITHTTIIHTVHRNTGTWALHTHMHTVRIHTYIHTYIHHSYMVLRAFTQNTAVPLPYSVQQQ
jgi:hypothetical protein